ncbi:MAG: L-threonine 3-dehydrogenase [Gammaproteobacteria bacterium CG_4_10_14_0_8_um_filter_38_16]|nr:MAG: L-threonine 3-dehydrogenase [Gammaproteobacteria bacterium CG_4_10_14_0_8_um_filter_38_16]PJA03807.1 MAG: L-threonine 3-dehydrogenase [Gammaproteobacteria bacterium CG_4_10_14_0_2_um_filter_38_22]PJB10781.1 MAG: L-threonine 3-dehydrogenase [Gammaproteobacteria bacterium CG_4_9_14_3_um_filter_38_9]
MKTLSKLKSEKGLWLSDASMPQCNDNDVLIKIKKTAICGTDLHIYNWDEWAQKTVPVPLIIGHEFMGEIVELGKNIKQFKVGDRVSGEGHLTCGHCRNCRAGARHLCRETKGIGYHVNGAFAEYFAMCADNVVKLSDDISDSVGAILDPYGNAVHTALEFDLVGEDVLITGAGPVGLMAIPIANKIGARHVVITDINPYRLKLASSLGATLAVDTTQTDLKTVMKKLGMTEGFDVGLEMSGNERAFQDMVMAMNHGGRIAMLGIPAKPFAIDWTQVIFKSLKIAGIYGRRMFETWYKGIALLQSGVDVSPIITAEYHYTDFEKAFTDMLSGHAGKVVLAWD